MVPECLFQSSGHHLVCWDPVAVVLSCDGLSSCPELGECRDGCCSLHRCPDCWAVFWVEWPD